ncbi:MAG: LysR substrate-binding domain-containing protein [Nitrospira sp.]|nr:LysR substrate-binding domain-containing protein [Nitrospira sp.]
MGALRLGAIATVGPYLLPDLVPLLHKRAPEMPLEIEENLTVNLTAMLKSGKLSTSS